MAIEKEDRWLWLENKIRDISEDLEILKIGLKLEEFIDDKSKKTKDKNEDGELTW